MQRQLRSVLALLVASGIFVGCGDDSSGAGGAGGSGAGGDGTGGSGSTSGSQTACQQGEEIFCKCADGSDGVKTCNGEAFSPCSNAGADCTR